MNDELMFKTLQAIEQRPEGWDQRTFADKTECGTTMCLAGWALVASGQYELEFKNLRVNGGEDICSSWDFRHKETGDWAVPDGEALKLLDLDGHLADELFYWTPGPWETSFDELVDRVKTCTEFDYWEYKRRVEATASA